MSHIHADLIVIKCFINCIVNQCTQTTPSFPSIPQLIKTGIELYENQVFYVFHPYVKEKSHIFKSENTVFLQHHLILHLVKDTTGKIRAAG